MPNTFTLIASSTVGSGGAASIEFTSIPGTYTDLCVLLSARTASADSSLNSLTMAFNGSPSYTLRRLYGAGSAGSDSANYNYWTVAPGNRTSTGNNNRSTISTFSDTVFYIPNYTSSNNKSVSIDMSSPNNVSTGEWWVGANAGSATLTSAITTITIAVWSEVVNLAQYSTATLYGIKNS